MDYFMGMGKEMGEVHPHFLDREQEGKTVSLAEIASILYGPISEPMLPHDRYRIILMDAPFAILEGGIQPACLEVFPNGFPGERDQELSVVYHNGDGAGEHRVRNIIGVELEEEAVIFYGRKHLSETSLKVHRNGFAEQKTAPVEEKRRELMEFLKKKKNRQNKPRRN